MIKSILSLLAMASFIMANGQGSDNDTAWKKEYRASATRINDLVHTRLEVRPDFSNSHLYGKAWLTLHPHFYKTDSLTLDAKGMQIKKIAVVKGAVQSPLRYQYDELALRIQLDRTYKAGEDYTIYIEYTAMPDEFEEKFARNQMLGIKGLYFINPKGEEKGKPTQIWTQGETESNSVWFPTIDRTNQKTTQELRITVDQKYVTLSNGKLVSQKKNPDNTRTDYWKMDLPHAPYLFFMGVGQYTIVKDTWKGKEVNYYVEPEYGTVARRIFGNTPEMMTFFSKLTGVEYPWIKYSQITGRDYVAGAMENTTATIHQNFAQQDARELIDGNSWESTIAHELFHQWFGDYVTAESWSNLTLNESFADYSQTLWQEYKYGKDAGDAENYDGLRNYLGSGSESKNLVRFFYSDREDMFDAVSYQKGGRILHMLRNYVGDEAFSKAMNLYLTTNKFRSAEAHQLRLAFEEVTGQDLNWFFNQWYFDNGNPSVEIDYVYNESQKKVTVVVRQVQKGKPFRLPLAIDIYNGSKKERFIRWTGNATDSFTFNYESRPDLVNVDADKVMLWTKKDYKTIDNYIHQYAYAGNYVDRLEAIDYISKRPADQKVNAFMAKALNDKYYGLRNLALSRIDLSKETGKAAYETIVAGLAKSDPKTVVRAEAISALAKTGKKEYAALYKEWVNDSSYSVAGASLEALSTIEPETALAISKQLNARPAKGWLKNAITQAVARSGDESLFDELFSNFTNLEMQSRFGELENLVIYLQALKNTEKFKKGVDELIKFKDEMPPALKDRTDPYLIQMLTSILDSKQAALKGDPSNAALREQAAYLSAYLGKKAF